MQIETNKPQNNKNIDYSKYKYTLENTVGFQAVPNPFNNLQYPTQLSIRINEVFQAVMQGSNRIMQVEVKNLVYNLTPALKEIVNGEYTRLVEEWEKEERSLQCVLRKAETPAEQETCAIRIMDLRHDYARYITHYILGLLDKKGLLLQPERQIERGGIG